MNKMGCVHGFKRRLSTTSLVNKYKNLKETERGQSCIENSRKFGVVKNAISNWIKNYNIKLRTFCESKN